MTRVKICGLTSVDDALAAVDAGADVLGLNFVPTSPRCITENMAADIRHAIPPLVHIVGVFADTPMERVHRLATRLELHYIQLHGFENADSLWHYKCPVIKAFRIQTPEVLQLVPAWDDDAAAILLDGAGRKDSHGGATFDWSLVATAKEMTSRPIIIAGGLTPENVAEAVRVTGAFAVDVASGVEEEPGKKDAGLMRAFIQAAKSVIPERRTA